MTTGLDQHSGLFESGDRRREIGSGGGDVREHATLFGVVPTGLLQRPSIRRRGPGRPRGPICGLRGGLDVPCRLHGHSRVVDGAVECRDTVRNPNGAQSARCSVLSWSSLDPA